MSHVSDALEPHKRKRDNDDTGAQSIHNDRIPQPPPPPQIGNSSYINYLSKSSSGKLDLIQGDADTFADVLGLINNYEGVLSRQESLAANLGAKLTGPRLLRAMESAFEGPIIISPSSPYGHAALSWLDVVTFAKASPEKFVLSTNSDGERTCQFTLNGVQAQILEDDWRLIVNGALNHFSVVPSAPLPEDETAELATLDIVEKRLQVLIKKADEVAKRARQLNYHLSGRKAAISSKRPNHQAAGAGFQSHSSQHRHGGQSSSYDLHADLLLQFQSHPSHSLTPRGSLGGAFEGGHGHLGIGHADNRLPPINLQPNRSPLSSISSMHQRELPENSADHRPAVTARIEKLGRGEAIHPPCDRCRRLKMPCIKYLTACQGCTKKHAKCGWKSITEAEIAWLERETGLSGDSEPPPVAYSHAQSTSSRYDPAHDEARHSGPESVGSRGEGSRPGSRGNQHASAPLSPGENGQGGGHSRQPSGYMDVDREPARSPSRPWEREMHYRNDHPPQQRDLGLLSQIASTAAAAADARDSRTNHSSATPSH
ncbi:hypothetical protein B0T11DRAFT_330403 [Plectosphaerella cucumerina]|uniref:Uncharacterized protein n=1 Tax=Plectosphaerella cucumerina TaxID=40658 RepID=A0A8K0TEE9_9PEZI|nr:hypothetical protein B0T11DRAFT_330403 [Plectosphaerella cucumerina]